VSFLVNVVLYLYLIHLVDSLCKLLFYALKVGMFFFNQNIHLIEDSRIIVEYCFDELCQFCIRFFKTFFVTTINGSLNFLY